MTRFKYHLAPTKLCSPLVLIDTRLKMASNLKKDQIISEQNLQYPDIS